MQTNERKNVPILKAERGAFSWWSCLPFYLAHLNERLECFALIRMLNDICDNYHLSISIAFGKRIWMSMPNRLTNLWANYSNVHLNNITHALALTLTFPLIQWIWKSQLTSKRKWKTKLTNKWARMQMIWDIEQTDKRTNERTKNKEREKANQSTGTCSLNFKATIKHLNQQQPSQLSWIFYNIVFRDFPISQFPLISRLSVFSLTDFWKQLVFLLFFFLFFSSFCSSISRWMSIWYEILHYVSHFLN